MAQSSSTSSMQLQSVDWIQLLCHSMQLCRGSCVTPCRQPGASKHNPTIKRIQVKIRRTIVSQRTVLSTVLLYYEQQQWTRDCAQSHQQHPLPLLRSSTRSICVRAHRPAHCVPIFLLSLFALRDFDFDRELQSMSRLCSDISETGRSFFITVLIQPSKVR